MLILHICVYFLIGAESLGWNWNVTFTSSECHSFSVFTNLKKILLTQSSVTIIILKILEFMNHCMLTTIYLHHVSVANPFNIINSSITYKTVMITC